MKYIMILSLLFIFSCSNKEFIKVPGEEVEVEKIVEIEVEKIVEVDKIIEKNQLFEGFYNLSNGGSIELVANARGDINIDSFNQYVLSVNPQNGTVAEHPIISGNHLIVIDKVIAFTRNVNYTTGYDIEEDDNGNNITGTRKTDYRILKVKGKLIITINIWSNKIRDNINFIVASRVITEE